MEAVYHLQILVRQGHPGPIDLTTDYASAKYLGENDLATDSERDTGLDMTLVKAYESYNSLVAGLCAYLST